MSLQHCRVVLIETHYPGNLGSTARVMRNFGLSDLVLVSPVADRQHRNARQMSTHGEDILQNARVVTDLSDAIGDSVLVVGTSARSGGLFRQQNIGMPDAIMRRVAETLRQDQPVALLFGPEANGLTNEVVTRCHHLINIPTHDVYSSLNLSQAVGICLYELNRAWERLTVQPPHPRPLSPGGERGESLASAEAQELMFRQLQTALEEIHFLYGDKAEPLMHAVRHLLGKAQLSEMEVKILLGLARQIRWYVAHHPDKIA